MARRGRKWFGSELDPNLGLRGVLLLDLLFKLVLLGLSAWPVIVAWRWWWVSLTADWQRVLFVLGMVLLFNFAYLLAVLLLRVIIPVPREGVFAIDKNKAKDPTVLVFLLNVALIKARFEPPWMMLFAPALWHMRPFYYLYRRWFGPHSRTVLMGENFVLTDPHLTYLGKNVTLGFDCMISAHVFEGKTLLIRRVEIADNVIIGARSVVGPGVRIGEGAVVMPNSVVAVFTQIGPGELWGGNPARQVQEGHTPGSFPKVGEKPQPASRAPQDQPPATEDRPSQVESAVD